jgi:ribosomal protein S18 acetylase RimI-like enzyme
MNQTYRVRPASSEDVSALAELHVLTFRETHGSSGPTVHFRAAQWQEAFRSARPSFCLVVEGSSGLVGFAKGIDRDEQELPDFKGELNKIYLLRRVQGLGLGRRLLCSSAAEFLARGIQSMVLFGDERNPSNGFYEHMGGERLFAANGDFHGGYGWKDLNQLVADQCVPKARTRL